MHDPTAQFRSMNVLITGGAGFIGSSVAQALKARGIEFMLFDNFDPYYSPALKIDNMTRLRISPLPLIQGDICDPQALEYTFSKYEFTHVLHLAAVPGVRPSFERPAHYAQVNTYGTVNVLEAAQRAGIQQVVLASSSSVYSDDDPPSLEYGPVRALSPYAASKQAAEVLALPFYSHYGMNVTILRLFNVYGPHGRPDMMPLRIMNALWHDEIIQLYHNGQVKRDWTYIDDVVDGILQALRIPLGYRILNLGRGEPVYIQTLVDVLSQYADKPPRIEYVPLPDSEIGITWADITAARQCLGFMPAVGIHEGLRRTWEWFKRE